MADKFKAFTVAQIVAESAVISSFYLTPKTSLLREFVPGEYLLFEHRAEGREPVRREYSISGQKGEAIRVTIKHATASDSQLPDGIVSTHFHKHLKVGDIVYAAGPAGKFLLDRSSARDVVLLSGGVGLTPMVAMAHELIDSSQRHTYFIHACDNGRVHALGDEMRGLAKKYGHFQTHFVYRQPDNNDLLGKDYQSEGVVTQELLDKLLMKTDCDYYLCGPPPFMQAIYLLLKGMGVPSAQIRYEFFGPATVLKSNQPVADALIKPVVLPVSEKAGKTTNITFSKSQLTVAWDGVADNLLEFAEEQGLMVDFSCRAGICDTCKTAVLRGEVSYPEAPFEMPPEGFALLCCSVPNGDLELAI